MESISYEKLSCEAVMLPQEDYFTKAERGIVEISGIMLHGSGLDYYTTSRDQWLKSILDIGGAPQHLYIISDRDPQPGELCMYMNGDGAGNLKKWIEPFVAGSAGAKYKIEASTRSSTYKPDENFIRAFITKTRHGIDVNRVKMTMHPETNRPLVNPEQNTVYLTYTKKTFTEAEFLKGLNDITYDIMNKTATACIDKDIETLKDIKSIFKDSDSIKKYVTDWYNKQDF